MARGSLSILTLQSFVVRSLAIFHYGRFVTTPRSRFIGPLHTHDFDLDAVADLHWLLNPIYKHASAIGIVREPTDTNVQ